jgi:hypothetical protein
MPKFSNRKAEDEVRIPSVSIAHYLLEAPSASAVQCSVV